MDIGGGVTVNLELWDTAGFERHAQSLPQSLFRYFFIYQSLLGAQQLINILGISLQPTDQMFAQIFY